MIIRPSRREVLQYGAALVASAWGRRQVRAPFRIGGSGATSLLQQADFAYQGYYDTSFEGLDSGFTQGLTCRYVSGDLRFLTIGWNSGVGILYEFSLSGQTYGNTINSTTNNWPMTQVFGSPAPLASSGYFIALWYESGTGRLWSAHSVDYGSSSTYYQTQLFTRTLNNTGNTCANLLGPVSLQNIGSKQVYGGVTPIPSAFQSAYGVGPYLCGWGGYTSLAAQMTNASFGPAMFAIPDISGYTSGQTISSSSFKIVAQCIGNALSNVTDWYASGSPSAFDRGVRLNRPYNYYDGGDNRNGPLETLTGGVVTVTGGVNVALTGATGGNFNPWWGGYTVTVGGTPTNYGPFNLQIAGTNYPIASVTDGSHLTLASAAPNGTGQSVTASPGTEPPFLPVDGSYWTSPAPDGKNRMVWGDSYYGTGNWINGTNKYGMIAIFSVGTGKNWYSDSTLNFDGRAYELHIFDPATLAASLQGSVNPWSVQPSSMGTLSLPGANTANGVGNLPTNNISGAVYDPTSGNLYLWHPNSATKASRLYVFSVTA